MKPEPRVKAKGKKETAEETQEEYRQRIMDVVCGVTAESTLGIQRICKTLREDDATFPACRTIRTWMAENAEMLAQYARAKEHQLHILAEQIVEISDDDSYDEIFTDEGKRMMNAEFVARSKLRVDSRKWVLSKLMPKVYGDKIEIDNNITMKELPTVNADEFV